MEDSTYRFATWRAAWCFARAVTFDGNEIHAWFSESARYLYLHARIRSEESGTRHCDLWNYYPGS